MYSENSWNYTELLLVVKIVSVVKAWNKFNIMEIDPA